MEILSERMLNMQQSEQHYCRYCEVLLTQTKQYCFTFIHKMGVKILYVFNIRLNNTLPNQRNIPFLVHRCAITK